MAEKEKKSLRCQKFKKFKLCARVHVFSASFWRLQGQPMSAQLRLRYLVVQAEWGALAEGGGGDALDPASAGPSDLFQALRATHQELFGDAGWGAVAPALAVTYYSTPGILFHAPRLRPVCREFQAAVRTGRR